MKETKKLQDTDVMEMISSLETGGSEWLERAANILKYQSEKHLSLKTDVVNLVIANSEDERDALGLIATIAKLEAMAREGNPFIVIRVQIANSEDVKAVSVDQPGYISDPDKFVEDAKHLLLDVDMSERMKFNSDVDFAARKEGVTWAMIFFITYLSLQQALERRSQEAN